MFLLFNGDFFYVGNGGFFYVGTLTRWVDTRSSAQEVRKYSDISLYLNGIQICTD
jgi:hypothetical protein